MKEKNRSTWDNFRMWLTIVLFLLVFPPGVPMALSTDSPLIGSCIAIAFALILGSFVWFISLYATDDEEIGSRDKSGKTPARKRSEEATRDIGENLEVRRKKPRLKTY